MAGGKSSRGWLGAKGTKANSLIQLIDSVRLPHRDLLSPCSVCAGRDKGSSIPVKENDDHAAVGLLI
jgi:hypothetical protein